MRSARLEVAAIVALLLPSLASAALPLQMLVNLRGTECLYDKLNEGEAVTASVFILSGQELKATVRLDGPVAALDADSGNSLYQSIDAFDKDAANRYAGNVENVVHSEEIVDFEHLNIKDEFAADEEADDELIKQATAKDLSPSERKRIKDKQRKKILVKRQKQEQQRLHQHKKVREEGQPFQTTLKVPAAGWYRFCVMGTFHQVTAEIEMRKESELGGTGEDGHVVSYDQKTMAEEDKMLEEDTAAEEGIKDEDFQATRDKLRQLRRLLAEIHSAQQKERRRLIVHAATNKHSHSRMVLSSLMETVLFMAVTGYQVYTIRRWFRGAPALGR